MKLAKWFVCVTAIGVPVYADASEYGCKVLLCLANPHGPTAVSECVPPITQLWDDLKHGRPFPSCDLAEGPNGKSFAQPGISYYDPCPEGTTALARGAHAVQGTTEATPVSDQLLRIGTAVHAGIGSGDDLSPASGLASATPFTSLPGKICVGNKLGDTNLVVPTQASDTHPVMALGGYSSLKASIYDRVVLLNPNILPRIIDVFIDGKPYRRVRW